MKRISILLAVILLVAVFVPTAFAAQEQLAIDNDNIYNGMGRSYTAGYIPTVSGGKATIVLPLVYEGSEGIVGDKITVTPDLGAPSNSPFVFSNYEMDIIQANNSVNNGASTVPSYLISLTIPLASDRVNGVYPVTFNTRFNAATTGEVQQSFVIYVTITDGIDPKATPEPTDPPKEPAPRPQPKIIVSKYELKSDTVLAGEPFDIKITLLNTEDYWHTKNIKVTYKGETSDLLVNSGNNTFYIDEIEDEETYSLTLKMKARLEAEPRPQKVLINIEYEDSKRTSYTVNEEIIVEIRQPLRLEMDEVSIPSEVNAGDSLPISMNIYNMGKSTIYNVLCTLDMKGVIPDGSAYLGNMESGASGTAEIYAFFGTLDMTADSSAVSNNTNEKYGRSDGTMTVTYEDEYGESYEEIIELNTNIERPVFDDIYNQEEEEEEVPEKASQWWVSVFLALGIIMILVGVISYRRKVSRLKRVYGDENI
jgi:hypothetical protein